jgi:hypothetical protein
MNFASLNPSSASSLFSTAFWACIGGLIVLLGLWIEKMADKKWYRDVHEFRRSKLKSEIGWWILMVGIAVEIGTAGRLAVKEELEIWQANNSAWKNDPRKLPLNSVTAFATILIKTNNVVPNMDSIIRQGNGNNPLRMRLYPKKGNVIELSSDSPPAIWRNYPESNSLEDPIVFSTQLSWSAAWRGFYQGWNSVSNRTNLTAGEVADSKFTVGLMPAFLRAGTLVTGGSVKVWFNGLSLERDFSILPKQIGAYPYLNCLPVVSSNTNSSLSAPKSLP